MVSEFVREQKRYSQDDLCKIFRCSEENVVFLIRKLKEFGILKVVKNSAMQREMSELLEEDVEVVDVEVGEDRYLYVFTYVGIVVVSGCVLKCYPKYIDRSNQPLQELRQVLRVLGKYNSKKQIVQMFNDSNQSSVFNLLAILLFFLQDYYENGVYSDTKKIIESNGTGEINWDKTINETFAIFINNRPYYIDIQTENRVEDEFDYFKRLHKYAITAASDELKNAGLLDLFGISEVSLSDEHLDDFGGKDYILYQIEKELNVQFNTRKQLVLKTIYTYIAQGGSLYDIDCLSLFGTNRFDKVWESVCADVLDNQLEVPLHDLHLPVSLRPSYDKHKKLIDIIEKPFWTITERTANNTLIPDTVVIDGTRFIIFDAKYYTPKFKKGVAPVGQPGIESVTKQYLYQLAYQKFIKDHKFTEIKNCFLLPTEEDEVVDGGEVSMKMLDNFNLESIKVRFLPARVVYDYYLNDKLLDILVL